MKLEKIQLGETGSFSPIFLDYLAEHPSLRPYYGRFPRPQSFGDQIKDKAAAFPASHRTTLVQVLQQQYAGLPEYAPVSDNLQALAQPNTFTVTTGHQLNIFTGPLYFIFKIATVVKACQTLAAQYPEHRFVPVYWMATEDHDLAEINHFHLWGKTYRWDTSQTGPVGRMKPEGLAELVDQLPEKVTLFEHAYRQSTTLAEAVRRYVHELFGEQGVVVVDGDQADLKREFAQHLAADLFDHTAHQQCTRVNAQLDEMGYRTQIHPREINLFYIQDGLRERIVREGDTWQVLNTDISFTEATLRAQLEAHPERFSPNVVLRPLYQEVILPNLAYAGGPAEVAYWLQLGGVFEAAQVPFPILMPRNFGLWLTPATQSKMEALGYGLPDLFTDTATLEAAYVKAHAQHDLTVEATRKEIEGLFARLTEQATAIDPTLEGTAQKELAQVMKRLTVLEKKMWHAEERNQETGLRQIKTLKETLFPGGSLQERHENFLAFYLNRPDFIEQVLHHFDAFDFRMHLFLESVPVREHTPA